MTYLLLFKHAIYTLIRLFSRMETFVHLIDKSKNKKLYDYLKEHSFEITIPPHTHYSAKKKGISITLFLSQKCVIQGKESKEFIEFFFEPEILEAFPITFKEEMAPSDPSIDFSPKIGVDESGKGDFFGPLVIAGVQADEEGIKRLLKIGVKDSKTLTDKTIHSLAEKIKKECPFQIVILNPSKYNEIYTSFQNLNALLAWGHATVLESLIAKTGCNRGLIDQFANEKIVIQALKRKKIELELTQRHKGEADPVVAAASILARDAFVTRLAQLSEEAGITLPKGASAQVIAAGKNLLQKIGRENLYKYVKLHFKTLDRLI